MKCPYCENEMRRGKIRTMGNSRPYWQEDGVKRTLSDFFDEKGWLADAFQVRFEIDSFYCPRCKKVIIDADLKL